MLGLIHVVCGCVRSGKTRELDFVLERYRLAGRKTRKVKCGAEDTVGCEQLGADGSIWAAQGLRESAADVDVLGIDDFHHATAGLDEVLVELSHSGKTFIVAGLSHDERGEPFLSLGRMVGIADSVKTLYAVCASCGRFDASRTTRTESGELEPRCPSCHSDGRPSDESSKSSGRLVVFTGCMFSGKTTRLISLLRRAQVSGVEVLLFKPEIDKRNYSGQVVSHDGKLWFDCSEVKGSNELLRRVYERRPHTVGIDEAQFFDAGIVQAVASILRLGINVVVSVLDQDAFECLWEESVGLFGIADEVEKLSARCSLCGKEAGKTYRKSGVRHKVLIGGVLEYEARCHRCFPH